MGLRLVVLALVLLTGAVSAQPANGVTLRGRVVEARDGRSPVPRVRVLATAAGLSFGPAVSDDQGHFVLSLPAAGRVTITASRVGYLTRTLTVDARSREIETSLVRGAVLTGRVFDPSGQPVSTAGVRIRRADGDGGGPGQTAERRATVDDLGEFRVSGLEAGEYTVSAFRDFNEHESPLPLGAPARGRIVPVTGIPEPMSETVGVRLAAGDEETIVLSYREQPARFNRQQLGSITGTLLDEVGEPAEGAHVRLLGATIHDWRRVARAGQSTSVDDRGRFRLFGITAGAYIIEAVYPASSTRASSRTVYHPDSGLLAGSAAMRVESGQDVSNITVTFPAKPDARVTGLAINASGPLSSGTATLASAYAPDAIALPPLTTPVASGTFQFPAVPPGRYVIRVTGRGAASPQFGIEYVTVFGNEEPAVIVRTEPMLEPRGQVVFDDPAYDPSRRTVGIAAVPVDPDRTMSEAMSRALATVLNDDYSFRMIGITGPSRFVLIAAPEGWWLKAVRTPVESRPQEIVDLAGSTSDLTLVIATDGAGLEGRVQSPRPLTSGSVTVLAFAADRELWFPESAFARSALVQGDGRFMFSSLPPGEYFVVAVEPPDPATAGSNWWQDPPLLESLMKDARRITLSPYERASVDLRPLRAAP